MAANKESIYRELYGMLNSKGYKPRSYLSSGTSAPIPEKADFIQFDFMYDGKSYGKVTITIDGRSMVVYYGSGIEDSPEADSHDSISFRTLGKQLKRFGFSHRLMYDPAKDDNLESDMARREHHKEEGLNEGYYPMGKKASYSDHVPTTKIILQHTRQIEEGEQRYRNVAKIFVENSQGERFLLDTNKPGIARVYARHIAEGGTPYDERGKHIGTIVEEYSKMAGFVRATRGKQFNESAQGLINEGATHYQNLRETLHKMAGQRGYKAYFESYTPSLMEDEGSEDLSEMFMTSSLDPRIESVMPILSKLRRAVSENIIPQAEELAEWADSIIEGNLSNDSEDIIDSDDLSEAPEEKIADKYDPEDFDAMVSRVGQKAKEQQRKNPVDIADLARRMHGVLSKDRSVKADEGLVGAALGGAAGAMLTKSPQGAISGANLGSTIQDELSETKKDFAASLKKNIEKSNQKKKETDKKVEQHQASKKGINEVDMGQADSTLRGGHKQSTDKMNQMPALLKAAKKMGYEHYTDVPDDKVSELKALAGKFRSGSEVNEGQRDLDTIKRLLGK